MDRQTDRPTHRLQRYWLLIHSPNQQPPYTQKLPQIGRGSFKRAGLGRCTRQFCWGMCVRTCVRMHPPSCDVHQPSNRPRPWPPHTNTKVTPHDTHPFPCLPPRHTCIPPRATSQRVRTHGAGGGGVCYANGHADQRLPTAQTSVKTHTRMHR